LTSLPPEIGNLTALKTLDLTNNKLTALPKALGRLTALETLTLKLNNTLTVPLPKVVAQGTKAILEFLRGLPD
jgi:Leucine-rich repeat (LRR) protein